jgi:hypothetical protein
VATERACTRPTCASDVVALIRQSGTLARPLPIVDGRTGGVPSTSLPAAISRAFVRIASLDRLVVGALEWTGATMLVLPETRAGDDRPCRMSGCAGMSDSFGVACETSDSDGMVWGTNCTDPNGQPVVWTNE